jgi:membrane protease YdiL (CAAX protease family)
LVAPWWHTLLLIALFLGLTMAGVLFQGAAQTQPGLVRQRPSMIPLYLSLIAAEWGLLIYVWKVGLRRSGTRLRDLIGGRWSKPKDVWLDVRLALGVWAVWTLSQIVWSGWLGSGQAASIETFLPQGVVEIPFWVALSVSAGVCEEVVFRGYFQRQFAALTRSQWLALALQALLFGVAHGYQGLASCAKITVYGVLFGLLALWRRSLRPGIMAHALTDILAGIFRV